MDFTRLLIVLLIMVLLLSACVATIEKIEEPSLDDFTPIPAYPPVPEGCLAEIIDGEFKGIICTLTKTPEPPTPEPTPTYIPITTHSGVILGSDWDPVYPDRVKFGTRSDVFIIYMIWMQGERMMGFHLVSLPRDLWVKVPCSPLDPSLEGYDRINAAYAYGEFDCVRETVAELGIEINMPIFYVEMTGFIELIDRMGGLSITPRKTYTDWCGVYHGTDGKKGSWVTWREGVEYHMDGQAVLCYARARSNSNDLDRNRRQLEIMGAIIRQYPAKIFDSENRLDALRKLVSTWEWASEYIQSDITMQHFIDYAGFGVDLMNRDIPYLFHRIPLEAVDFWRTPIYGASVLKPRIDVKAWIQCTIHRLEYVPDEPTCVEETLLEED